MGKEYDWTKEKEYRLERITSNQGHYYNLDNLEQARRQALKNANETNSVWVYQKWKPQRGKPFLARPKSMKNMTIKQIIVHYKKDGFDVRRYGGS